MAFVAGNQKDVSDNMFTFFFALFFWYIKIGKCGIIAHETNHPQTPKLRRINNYMSACHQRLTFKRCHWKENENGMWYYDVFAWNELTISLFCKQWQYWCVTHWWHQSLTSFLRMRQWRHWCTINIDDNSYEIYTHFERLRHYCGIHNFTIMR